MKRLTNNETSKDREARIPKGKIYGVFNGDLRMLDDEEVVEMYGMPFGDMTGSYRMGVGIFKLPDHWLPKRSEETGKAKWKEVYAPHATYYYFDR